MNDRSSPGPLSAVENPDTWDRVASELQALRRSQEEAYGSVDSALLGRFLAGECDATEHERVERALATHPELQLLTDLVREVLSDAPAIEEPRTTVRPAPEAGPTVLAFTPRKRRPFAWQRLGTLVAAACLFLVLGVGALPMAGGLAGPNAESASLTLGEGSASRAPLPMLVRSGSRSAPPPVALPGALPGTSVADSLPGVLDASTAESSALRTAPPDLVVQTQKRPTTPDTARRAYHLMQQGYQFQRDGQVDRAARALELAHELCQNRVGPQHPQTRMMAVNLAQMYGDALNDPARTGLERGPAHAKSVGNGPDRTPIAAPPTLPGAGVLAGGNAPTDADKGQYRVALRSRLDRKKAIEIQQRVVPVLSMGLRHAEQLEDRVTLIGALSELGPSASPSVGILTDRLHKSTEPREQVALLEALRRIGPDARLALPVLNEIATRENVGTPMLARQAQELIGHLNSPAGRVGVHDSLGLFSLAAVRESVEKFQQQAGKRELFVEVPRYAPSPLLVKSRLKYLGPQAILVVMRRHSVEILPAGTLKTERPLPLETIKAAIQEHLKNEDPDAALREVYRLAE